MELELPKLKGLLAGILLLFPFQNIVAQSQPPALPAIIPPSPNAAELGRYATLDIGLQTGSLNYEIPLFNISADGVNIPIGIQYSASGIRVDQMSSICGMGWVLNAGGVVTRSINGFQDEVSTRSSLPANWSLMDASFIGYLRTVTAQTSPNGMDTEPDEFVYNFNGYHGKFVLDGDKQPVLMPHSNLKVELFYSGSNYSGIKVGTPDGCVYRFDGQELSYLSTIHYGDYTQASPPVSTAWYLTRIDLPNGESVGFTYDNCTYSYYGGVSQTMSLSDNRENAGNPCASCPVFYKEDVYVNSMSSAGKRLRSITYRNTFVSFDYSRRMDMETADSHTPGIDMLLSGVNISTGGLPVKSYVLNYETPAADDRFQSPYGTYQSLKYRPFLKELAEGGYGGTVPKRYRFQYEDIGGLPPRLSYSQDLWGYFNGRLNPVFIARPELAEDQQRFTTATADRDPYLESAIKGALTKIVYPTGGSDSIVYELNNYRYGYQSSAPTATKSVSISPRTGYPYTVSSSVFAPYSSQNARLAGGVILASGSDGSSGIDPQTDLLYVEVVRQADNQSVFTATLKASDHLDETLQGMDPGVGYVLKITSLYPNIKCSAGITYETGAGQTLYANRDVGGLRVAKTIHDDGLKRSVKRYLYSSLDDLSASSGVRGPLYRNIVSQPAIARCQTGDSPDGGVPGEGADVRPCRNWTASSSSLANVYRYGQNHVYYGSVIETDGESLENGGIAHSYILSPDQLSKSLLGASPVLGLRTSNTGILNGMENEQLAFRKSGGSIVPIRRTVNSYKEDTRVNKVVDAYIFRQYYDYPYHHTNPVKDEFDGFQVDKYGFYSKWAYMDSSTVYYYNPDGTLSMTEKTVYQYNSPTNTSIGQTDRTNSRQQTVRATFLYPNDMVSSGRDPSGVYRQMTDRNIIAPVVDRASSLLGGATPVPVFRVVKDYWNPNGSVFAVRSVSVQNGSGPLTKLFQMNAYDSYGNIQEQQKAGDVTEVYLWGYKGQYPVAKIVGSDFSTVNQKVDTSVLNNGTDAQRIQQLTNLRTVFVSNPQVQVWTYTYAPLVGMTSETDPKGVTTYYEYDGFGRLQYARDKDGNILKKYAYNYTNQ